MKKLTTLFFVLCSVLSFGQSEEKKEIIIETVQTDDKYIAGETIRVNAAVKGDLVIAGGKLIVNDSIYGDFIGAGGDLLIEGYIMDDVRVAGGKINIDSEIGDDLVVFGGEVFISKNARINGKLVCFAGDVTINGEIVEGLEVRGGEVFINGTIQGNSKLIGEDITIGSDAKFYGDVEYWDADKDLDFKNSLVNVNAQYNEDLGDEQSQLSLRTFGTNSLKLWVYYVLSAFLVILVMHALFRNAFSSAVEDLKNHFLKSFGYGLIYLFGIPFLILLTFLMIIGIPLGLFVTVVFLFSLLFGHLVAALLVAYYLKNRNKKKLEFLAHYFYSVIMCNHIAFGYHHSVFGHITFNNYTFNCLWCADPRSIPFKKTN